jgi:hypothetical protein
MRDHKSSLVLMRAGAYHSPKLTLLGKRFDLGGVAEALIYYDRVLVVVDEPGDVEELVFWFGEKGRLAEMLELLRLGQLGLYHYAFSSGLAIPPGGDPIPMNFQREDQQLPNSLATALQGSPTFGAAILDRPQRTALVNALCQSIVEVKAAGFGAAVDNALDDVADPKRGALVAQAFVNEVHEGKAKMGRPQTVTPEVEKRAGKLTVTWNVDFPVLGKALGEPGFDARTVVVSAIHANRLIWSAAELGSDLFLGSPMSAIVADKLLEVEVRAGRPKEILEQLESSVEFPDVRKLVNDGSFSIDEVLLLRSKAGRFRGWLQSEADRNRDAIIAYHNEVGKEAGFVKSGRTVLRILGFLGPPLAGVAAASHSSDPLLGPVTTAATKFLFETASRLGEGWRPVVFGKWARDYADRVLAQTLPRRKVTRP